MIYPLICFLYLFLELLLINDQCLGLVLKISYYSSPIFLSLYFTLRDIFSSSFSKILLRFSFLLPIFNSLFFFFKCNILLLFHV